MATKETGTIEKTVISDLCTGCGTCLSVCPTEAIMLRKDSKNGRQLPYISLTAGLAGILGS